MSTVVTIRQLALHSVFVQNTVSTFATICQFVHVPIFVSTHHLVLLLMLSFVATCEPACHSSPQHWNSRKVTLHQKSCNPMISKIQLYFVTMSIISTSIHHSGCDILSETTVYLRIGDIRQSQNSKNRMQNSISLRRKTPAQKSDQIISKTDINL